MTRLKVGFKHRKISEVIFVAHYIRDFGLSLA